MSSQNFWDEVKVQRAALPDPVYLTSIGNPVSGIRGGVTLLADREAAARCIANRTHRQATPEEVQAHNRAEEAHRAEVQRRHVESRKQFMELTNPEQIPTLKKEPK